MKLSFIVLFWQLSRKSGITMLSQPRELSTSQKLVESLLEFEIWRKLSLKPNFVQKFANLPFRNAYGTHKSWVLQNVCSKHKFETLVVKSWCFCITDFQDTSGTCFGRTEHENKMWANLQFLSEVLQMWAFCVIFALFWCAFLKSDTTCRSRMNIYCQFWHIFSLMWVQKSAFGFS